MNDLILLENGALVDPDTGELTNIPMADIDDSLKFTAHRRHEAKAQEDAYKAYRVVLDQVLLRNQVLRRTVYDDLDVSVKSASYSTFDTEAWRAAIEGVEMTRDELLAIALAATGFDKDALPAVALPAYEGAVKRHDKKPWIESRVVRKPAPKLTTVPRDDLSDWQETLDQLTAVPS